MPSVLVVEDNEFIRTALEHLMDKEGMLVAVANNGAEAFRLLDSIRFDLMITDMMMPEVTGIEVIKHIKKDPDKAHMGIIVVSSMDAERFVNDAYRLGVDEYIVKPFMPFELMLRIKKVFSEKGIR